jgi:hypothetical protein
MTFPLSISSSIFSLLTSRGVELLRPLPVQSGGSPRLHPITNELRTQRFTISATSLALAKKSDSTASPVRTASQTAHAERNEAPTALVVVLRPRSVGVVLQRKEPDFPRLFCSVMLIAKSSGYSRARATTSTRRSPLFRSLGLSGGTNNTSASARQDSAQRRTVYASTTGTNRLSRTSLVKRPPASDQRLHKSFLVL